MKQIVSNKGVKIVTEVVKERMGIVLFKNISVTHNTSIDLLKVSMDVYERKIHEVVGDENGEENLMQTTEEIKLGIIRDEYSRDKVSQSRSHSYSITKSDDLRLKYFLSKIITLAIFT